MSYSITTFELPTTFVSSPVDEVIAKVKKDKFIKLNTDGLSLESIIDSPSFDRDYLDCNMAPSTMDLYKSTEPAMYASVYCNDCCRQHFIPVSAIESAIVAPCDNCQHEGTVQRSDDSISGFAIHSLMYKLGKVMSNSKKILEALTSPQSSYALAA